jgi:chromosome segregation ATPase
MSLKSSRKSNVDDRVGKYNHAVVGLELKKTDLEQVIGDLEFKIKELNLQIEGQEAEISKRGERIISLSDTSREIEALIEKSKGNASKLSKDMHSKIKIS